MVGACLYFFVAATCLPQDMPVSRAAAGRDWKTYGESDYRKIFDTLPEIL